MAGLELIALRLRLEAADDVIGVLDAGHPGCPVGACLHWGALLGTAYVDPLSLLGPVRVRLKPLSG